MKIALSTTLALALAAGSAFAAGNVAQFGNGVFTPNAPQAAPQPQRTGLDLRAGFVDTSAGMTAGEIAAVLASAAPLEPRVIQLDGAMTPARRTALEAAGLTVGQYLPTNAFIVWTEPGRRVAAGLPAFVRFASVYGEAWKLAPELAQPIYTTPERLALRQAGKDLVLVHTFATAAVNAVEASLAQLPGARVFESNPIGEIAGRQVWEIRMEIGLDGLAGIPAIGGVRWVEPQPELDLRSNTNTRWIIQSNVSGVTPFDAAGLNGTGQIVGVIDGGMNVNHCAFRDTVNPVGPSHRKVVLLGSTAYSQHGTHCAGTAVGLPEGTGWAADLRGIAWGAKLAYGGNYNTAVSDWNFYSLANAQHGAGARSHSNSWGTTSDRSYSALVAGVDRFAWENEDSLVLVAVMNCAATSTGLVLAPENAKNCLGVGATGPAGSQDSVGSACTGPTLQGSRRPEIWAPGQNTVSASGSGAVCTTASLTGTSMATPAVAGAAAIVRDYFVEGFYPTGAAVSANVLVPTGALMRSVLVNAGQDMTGITGYAGPRENWGRLELDRSLPLAPLGTRRLIVRDVRNALGLSTGQVVQIPIVVSTPNETLRVTMAFHEPQGTAGTTNPFINNLNLEVVSPTGVVYIGNNFNGTATATTAGAAAADANDNLENVFVNAPEVGTWNVRVIAAAVNQSTQGYALAISGAVSEPVVVACPADCDASGSLSMADFTCFLGKYRAGDSSADCDVSGSLSPADFTCFLEKYRAGCP